MATRDRPELLRRAVSAVLAQDYPGEVECVVVFDQSDPEPLEVSVPQGRSVRIIGNHRPAGLAGARNAGITTAEGDLVAFCDDDDEWLPGKLRAQVELLLAEPDCSVVTTGIYVNNHDIDIDIERLAPQRPLVLADFLRDRIMEVHPSTYLMRRAALLDDIGLVDEAVPGSYGEDYEWILRAAKYGPVRSVPAPLVRINWTTSSFFAARWHTIASGLRYVLDSHPEFAGERRGSARIQGQIAFAHAALGEWREALRWCRQAAVSSAIEPRVYLAVLVVLRLVTAQQVVDVLQRRGRGI
jgi:glycosyltransferase involved in cell wall biosynthesis